MEPLDLEDDPEALKQYHAQGKVCPCSNEKDAIDQLIAMWKRDITHSATESANTIIVTQSPEKALQLNERCQKELRGIETPLATLSGVPVHKGDRLFSYDSHPDSFLRDGDFATVLSFNERLVAANVKLDRGKTVAISAEEAPPVTLGYAVPHHKLDTISAKNVHVFTGNESLKRELFSLLKDLPPTTNLTIYTDRSRLPQLSADDARNLNDSATEPHGSQQTRENDTARTQQRHL